MDISRRKFVAASAALIAMPVIACSAEPSDNATGPRAGANAVAGQAMAIAVHKDPGCPCCDTWAELARQAGYRVTVSDDPRIADRKRRLGVPQDLWSCHTSEAGGYAFEGHVPIDDMRRLLESEDRSIAGLAVAGMPLGSPGMEAGGTVHPYKVFAFTRSGGRSVYAEYPARG